MTSLFIDTNVMIDFLGQRHPFYDDIAKLTVLAERQEVSITASSLSFVNSFYVLLKVYDKKSLHEILLKFRVICKVSNVDEIHIDKSLLLNSRDFEDAVQYHSALHHKCDIFITRNKKDFKKAELPIMTPAEFLTSIKKR